MLVNVDISDLFFNSFHATDGHGNYTDLEAEAETFLDSLMRLNVDDLPTEGELVEDFYARL